jgi:hypothetical protein
MAAVGIALLILAHAMDYATFLAMIVRHGISIELNPLVSALARDYGLALLTAAKVAAVLLVAATFMHLARTHPRAARSVLGVGIVVGTFGAFSNVISL